MRERPSSRAWSTFSGVQLSELLTVSSASANRVLKLSRDMAVQLRTADEGQHLRVGVRLVPLSATTKATVRGAQSRNTRTRLFIARLTSPDVCTRRTRREIALVGVPLSVGVEMRGRKNSYRVVASRAGQQRRCTRYDDAKSVVTGRYY